MERQHGMETRSMRKCRKTETDNDYVQLGDDYDEGGEEEYVDDEDEDEEYHDEHEQHRTDAEIVWLATRLIDLLIKRLNDAKTVDSQLVGNHNGR